MTDVKKKNWISKDGKIITLFFFFEIFIFAIIAVLTFVPSMRKIVLGRNIKSRTDAIKRGFGYYSDPDVGECFTESGNCETDGNRFIIQRCIPNFKNGRNGVGCIAEDGLFTYNMIIEEQRCNQQCYSEIISVKDNINVTKQDSGKIIVTNVGTHQLLDKTTGLVMSDYFIGDFDLKNMTYDLKNCIIDEKRYAGFKERKYTCQNSTPGGINGCVYACGTDPTLNFNSSVTQNTSQFLGSIPFPYYLDGDEKIFVCKDIQDNNYVEIFNHGQTIPTDFILPEKCYNHVNLFAPPEGADILILQENTRYDISDRYIYIKQGSNVLSPYFQLDYNYVNNLRTYVKIISNQEIMLLSRLFSGNGGISSIDNDGQYISYVAVPKSVFTQQDIDNSTKINFSGTDNFTNINIIDTPINQGDFYYLPFHLIIDMFKDLTKTDGTYIYNQSEGDLYLKLTGLDTATTYYIFIKYQNSSHWVPGIFKVEYSSDQWLISNNNTPYFAPPSSSGVFSFYAIPYSIFSVSLDGAGTKNFTLVLNSLILTGSMFVDNFSLGNASITVQKITKTVDPTVGFYIRGIPITGSPTASISKYGYYYPLYLSQVNSEQTYISFVFEDYGTIIFYMPSNTQNLEMTYVSGSWENYEYLRGVGSINIPTITIQLNYGPGGSANPFRAISWTTPNVIMPGQGYVANQFYTISDTSSRVYINGLQNNGNTLLEVVRNDDPLFETSEILEGQLRKTVLLYGNESYQVEIYPEKILQVERDFGNFLGPYTEDEDGKRSFVCTDSTGVPLPDGDLIQFNIGETITALIQDYNFNTNIPSQCGTIQVNGTPCRENRDQNNFTVSDVCNVFNPDGNYAGVNNFLEDGYVLEDDNKLSCYVDGVIVDDNRCTKPFLTDYYQSNSVYDINQELILNNGDTKTYISLENNNTSFPGADSWATFSRIQEIDFNVGQYLGQNQTYITTKPGSIFMNMDYQIKYLTMLKYRTDSEYTKTEGYVNGQGMNFNPFKEYFNVSTPYLVSPINTDIQFTMTNSSILNPIIKISLPNQNLEDRVFLEENYLNILIWYMSSYYFLSNKISGTENLFSSLEGISFVGLGQHGVTLDIMNTGTDMALWGTGQKSDLTGYYCYFIPFLACDEHSDRTNFDALYPYQWLAYIYNLYQPNTNYPSKFEVVYVSELDNAQTPPQIRIVRNVTSIPDQQRFTFINTPTQDPSGIDASLGLFFPISKSGPFPRLHQLDSDNSFSLNFNMPDVASGEIGYDILTQHLSTGLLPVNGEGKTESFFNYGYSGFTIKDQFQSPWYGVNGKNQLVQYNQTQNRTGSLAYIKQIRVTSEGKIYITQVGDGVLIFRSGDIITFSNTNFNILGINPIILWTDGSTFEQFDYELQPTSGSFIQDYANDKYFTNYVKYNTTDRIIPSIYTSSPGNHQFILRSRYDPTNPSIVNIIPSSVASPGSDQAEITVPQTDISFLQDPESNTLTGDAGQFIRLVNSGELVTSTLQSLNIQGLGTIIVDQVIGKPYGRMSFVDGFSNNYEDVIAGRSFISKFSTNNINLGQTTRYEIDGYNFGVEEVQMAIVNMVLKTYTPGLPTYTGNEGIYILGDVYLFTDFRSKLTYRNQSDNNITFDPTHIESNIWADNGQINPQIDYKFYHTGEIYSQGDIVKYNDILWKANVNITLNPNREPPGTGNSSWIQHDPSGDLFSSLNYFTASLSDIVDSEVNSIVNLTVTSAGDTHIFPSPITTYNNYYINTPQYTFNTRYRLDMTGTPVLYLSSNGVIMDSKYNFTENGYILELIYYLDNIEVSRSEYITDYSLADKVEISMQMRRGETSLLTTTLISQVNSLQIGSTDGELLFVNNGQSITQTIQNLNKLDNQNIPIRISNYGELGYCFEGCSKNISDSYDTDPFGFIQFLGDDLITNFFNNRLRGWSITDTSFVSLSNEPCNNLSSADQRYLVPCNSEEGKDTYSQYLFEIPTLNPDTYGVPFCGTTGPDSYDSFIYSNILFLYFVPMDIDSQNLLKFEIKDETNKIINAVRYFHFYGDGDENNLTTSGSIVKASDGSYSQLSNQITISLGSNQTRLATNSFNKEILNMGATTIVNGNDKITFTPTVFDMRYQFSITDTATAFDQWWVQDGSRTISHGFFYPSGVQPITQDNMVKLSFIDDLESYNPSSPKIYYQGDTTGTSVILSSYSIEDFTLVAQGTISTVPGIRQFSSQTGNIKVDVYFDGAGNMFQAGDYTYTGGTGVETGDTIYQKWKGDECICKCYLNYGNNNATLSYSINSPSIPTIDGDYLVPLIFNRTKNGILSLENEPLSLVSGNNLKELDRFNNTFIINNGQLIPNPIQKPFNLNQSSKFFPNLYISSPEFGVINSSLSSNLTGSKLSNFSISDYGDAVNYLIGIDGEDQNSYLTNSQLEIFSYRQNIVRSNYPDEPYQCNIILNPLTIEPLFTQDNHKLIENSSQVITTDTGGFSITFRTNNYILLTQDKTPDPLELLNGTVPITVENTEFSDNQYLTIRYFLDNIKVSRTDYLNVTIFRKATFRYISLIFETEFVQNTVPNLTTIKSKNSVNDSDSITITIVENN